MAERLNFTIKRISSFRCVSNKHQDILWDENCRELGVRITPTGKPSYIFQSRFSGNSIRITIGSINAWSIPAARDRAREFKRYIDGGRDPRLVLSERKAEDNAHRSTLKSGNLTVKTAWDRYISDRKPHWGQRHFNDHLDMSEERRAYKSDPSKKTKQGILNPIIKLRLVDLNSSIIENWVRKEVKKRPARLRLALRLLKAFLHWCSQESEFKSVLQTNIVNSRRLKGIIGISKPKTDSLQKEQLLWWFKEIQSLNNSLASVYLQTLLLTGARKNEIAEIRWEDVDFRWNTIKLDDKVEEQREIPLTPFVSKLLDDLPRCNEWVFPSKMTKGGHIKDVRASHNLACKKAGISHLSINGLRRSFKSLSEWIELPIGVVAQIMGHKPSATAERHYTVRPVDLLRVHHTKLENWILEIAGIEIKGKVEKANLKIAVG